MALNAVLIGAIFAVAGYVAQHPPEWPSRYGLKGTWLKAALWLIAVFFSLPMVIATSRKLQALGQLIAETNVTEASAGARTAAIRAVVAQIVPIIGTVVLGIYIIVLSSALLPSVKVFFGLLLTTAVLSLALRRSFIKVYSKAQFALQETLSKPAEPQPGEGQAVLPSLLRDANVELVKMPADSAAARKLIRELQLRTQTGASIIGIERGGESLINPGPDEELRAGDQILLLGNRAQLGLARKALEKAVG
jgi:CPA2 family monovalent cation:H+ antiporter-2